MRQQVSLKASETQGSKTSKFKGNNPIYLTQGFLKKAFIKIEFYVQNFDFPCGLKW